MQIKKILFSLLSFAMTMGAHGQGMTDAYRYSTTQLSGTARFMSMAGAFGALGGDITTLSYNPAGIGVYRNSDISLSLSLQSVNAQVQTRTPSLTDNVTHLSFDNVGYVATVNLGNSGELLNLNFGFAYNRLCNYSRTFSARYVDASATLGNFVAQNTTDDFHNMENGGRAYHRTGIPWLSILGYQSYLITPQDGHDNRYFGTTQGYRDRSMSTLRVQESGRIDEYTLNFGGNVSNSFYWGLGVGILDLSYGLSSYYSDKFSYNHAIQTAIPPVPGQTYPTGGSYNLDNYLSTRGTGFNLKLGVIGRLGDVVRLGLAMHTPTFYHLTDQYSAETSFQNMPNFKPATGSPRFVNSTDPNVSPTGYIITPQGRMPYRLNTPWRFIGSAAFVLGKKGIISADYELVQYKGMHLSDDYGQYIDNEHINNSYQIQHAIRVGGEFRVTPRLSVRAGYALYLSPVKQEVRDGRLSVATAGTITQYSLLNNTNYYTAGLGYRWTHFYLDLAYSYRHQNDNFFPFSPTQNASPEIANLITNTHGVILTAGVKF